MEIRKVSTEWSDWVSGSFGWWLDGQRVDKWLEPFHMAKEASLFLADQRDGEGIFVGSGLC